MLHQTAAGKAPSRWLPPVGLGSRLVAAWQPRPSRIAGAAVFALPSKQQFSVLFRSESS
jgi:hypothetical protein